MATTTVKTQTPALVTASASSFYTVTAGSVVGNTKELLLCNTDLAVDYNVTAYNVPSGQVAGASYMFMNATTISAGVTVRFPFNTFLAAGTQVQLVANSASKIMALVSAVEYS